MPIEIGIWRLGDKPERVDFSPMETEEKLEDILASDLSILSPNLMLIGRQIYTAHGYYIDILAMNEEGNLIIVEIKKNKTPRDVVAQALDYASWVQGLSYEEISGIYGEKNPGKEFEEGFFEAFASNPPLKLNQSHEMVVVASELDQSTERIIDYLSDNFGVPVNALFFRHFKEGSKEYLTRTWLLDPQEVEAKTSKSVKQKGGESWNGRDFYVCIGEDHRRTWDDCVKYGFVSGGGGKWYSQTLGHLFPGARVFVNVPSKGYVGVGVVEEKVVPVNEFKVSVNGKEISILEAPLKAQNMGEDAEDPLKSEYIVRVKWEKTDSTEDGYWDTGLFAVQHTACRLRNKFTLEKLTQHFGLDE
jgi:hypothetical protein